MKSRTSLKLSISGVTLGVVGALMLVSCLAIPASADPIPPGYICVGGCGTLGPNGVVPISPVGNAKYLYATTTGGVVGVGALPTGKLGSETNGSTLQSPVFTANPGALLKFYFDYVTSDGAGFADYAWAALFNTANPLSPTILFTARTKPSGTIVPGVGMPLPAATLTPPSVPIKPGTMWSPLGSWSGGCYSAGCGNTGWVESKYTIGTAGTYYIKIGTVNWLDTFYDSGIAFDGITIDGIPIDVPEPATLTLLGLGLAAFGGMLRRRKEQLAA